MSCECDDQCSEGLYCDQEVLQCFKKSKDNCNFNTKACQTYQSMKQGNKRNDTIERCLGVECKFDYECQSGYCNQLSHQCDIQPSNIPTCNISIQICTQSTINRCSGIQCTCDNECKSSFCLDSICQSKEQSENYHCEIRKEVCRRDIASQVLTFKSSFNRCDGMGCLASAYYQLSESENYKQDIILQNRQRLANEVSGIYWLKNGKGSFSGSHQATWGPRNKPSSSFKEKSISRVSQMVIPTNVISIEDCKSGFCLVNKIFVSEDNALGKCVIEDDTIVFANTLRDPKANRCINSKCILDSDCQSNFCKYNKEMVGVVCRPIEERTKLECNHTLQYPV
ncbi:hypothetical protein FGO68_gene13884 [Halteria grandinella]|uniref:Uncharacterized protein n=1 Tax=Halteria grandinella TaxID=5974 RepID=A0A8J8T7M0_HALGN|nr:hypothetical protein FGO68_gene13884 [Halteria grandinella]